MAKVCADLLLLLDQRTFYLLCDGSAIKDHAVLVHTPKRSKHGGTVITIPHRTTYKGQNVESRRMTLNCIRSLSQISDENFKSSNARYREGNIAFLLKSQLKILPTVSGLVVEIGLFKIPALRYQRLQPNC